MVDFSNSKLWALTLASNELYKVWPRQQILSAFLAGRAPQVINDNVADYFTPLIQVHNF